MIGGILIQEKRGEFETQRRRDTWKKAEANIGVVCLQAKGHQELPGAGISKRWLSPERLWREQGPANILTSDFRLPKP